MSTTIKQSPLGANSCASLLQNSGLSINPFASLYMGVSKVNDTYTPGSTINDTCLFLLTYGINHAYSNSLLTDAIYNNLISIGSNTIPALGNSKPPTYIIEDPSNQWSGEATTGYGIAGDTGQGQEATWIPYDTTNPNVSITQWGFLRCFALQAWNEFNYNGVPAAVNMPEYKEFLASLNQILGYIGTTNSLINAFYYGSSYLEGVYSNMDDLICADITNVSLSTRVFGQDCITLGKVIDLAKIDKFGLPSVLLQTIRKYNANTQSLSLALLASGLQVEDIENISTEVSTASQLQEQQIYGAFLIIVGQDLRDILTPLNCKTQGLTSLADLLNIQKMFPNSFRSLTVPIYNVDQTVNNSKTFYLIYDSIGVNSSLNNESIKNIIGTLIPLGSPIVRANNTGTDIQVLPKGFNSYLVGILPNDIGIAAGAFAYSLRQVKNIQSVDFEKFSQVCTNMETTKELTLINGTNVPCDKQLMADGYDVIALGSGVNQTYVVSDFLGSMSALPYDWEKLTNLIKNTQTTKLSNIYYELYLAITWLEAILSLTITETSPGVFQCTDIAITDAGGGYGRGTGGSPIITINNGATATCTIGTDSTDIDTFGKVTGVTITNQGTSISGTGWTVSIQAPPTDTLPVQGNGNRSTSGVNTPSGTTGYPAPLQTVVSDYITQANTEIQQIFSSNSLNVQSLNKLYEQFGKQLKIEQRARFIGLGNVSIPRDTRENNYITTITGFVDSLATYSQQTLPHMEAQTIESICNLNTAGGQSITGVMRSVRNQQKLAEIGVPMDDTISTGQEAKIEKELLCQGVVGYKVNGVSQTTPPSIERQVIDGKVVKPMQMGECVLPYPEAQEKVYVIDGKPIDTGKSDVIGSFASSPATNLIPLNLNVAWSSGTKLPVTYTVQEAIEKVIHCNCDCWIQ